MLLLLRQQRNSSTFLRRSRRFQRSGGSFPCSFFSASAAAAYDFLLSSSPSLDDVLSSSRHAAPEPPPLSSQADRSPFQGAFHVPTEAPACPSVGDPRLRLLSECHALARSGRRRELKAALHRLVRCEGSGSAPSVCRSLLNVFRGGERKALVWDSLLELYARHGMPRDAIFIFEEMNKRRIRSSSGACERLIRSLSDPDMVWEFYEKIRTHGEVIPSDIPIHGVLLGHFCTQGWIKEAVTFFQEKRGSGELQICPAVFNAMIRGSSTFTAKSLISLMIKSGISPDKSTYNSLIQELSKEGSLEEALALSVAMEREGVENGVATFNSLIHGFCLQGMMKMVWKLLKMMLARGLRPGHLTRRALMLGHFQGGNIEEGLKIMNTILAMGCRMNIITCNIIFGALCEAGRLEDLQRLLHEIHHHGPELDQTAYSTLIHGFSKLGETEKALELSQAMAARGISPNSYNHLSLIMSLCRKGHLVEARRHLRHLQQAAQAPPVTSAALYNAAMDGHGKAGNLNGVLCLLGEMIKSGIAPTIITFNSIIHALCCCGKAKEGRSLKESMLRHGPAPNAVSYTTLLDAYCREGDIAAMVDLFDEMMGRGVVPNTVTYSVIMKGFCRAGQLDEAATVLQDMLSKNIPADQIAFNTLIQGFCEAGDVEMALRLHDEMVSHVQPSPVTYNLLLNALCVSRNLSAAETLLDDLQEKGVRLRKFAFTALIKAECAMGSSQKAAILFEKMIRAGFEPTVEDFTAAIRRLCKRRHLKDAMVFLHMMLQAKVYPDEMLFDSLLEAFNGEDDYRAVLALHWKLIKERR